MIKNYRSVILALCFGLLWAGAAGAADKPAAVYGSGAQKFSLAAGSPGELGLLKVLAETF